jgi:release factor glutamine methyltransferase
MGVAHFMDFEFETGNVTLMPRFETEILVEKAVEFLTKGAPGGVRRDILDIGTGCGNIAISLTNYIPSSRIVALDISDAAIRVARENALKHGAEGRIEFVKSDLFGNMWERRGLFDLIISNPPYVSLADMAALPEEVKSDPYLALYGGSDGADFYRKIVKDAHFFLKEGGALLMEIGYNQAAPVKGMLAEAPAHYKEIEIYKDYSGIDRIIKAGKNG